MLTPFFQFLRIGHVCVDASTNDVWIASFSEENLQKSEHYGSYCHTRQQLAPQTNSPHTWNDHLWCRNDNDDIGFVFELCAAEYSPFYRLVLCARIAHFWGLGPCDRPPTSSPLISQAFKLKIGFRNKNFSM
jgi:hypothetical protein